MTLLRKLKSFRASVNPSIIKSMTFGLGTGYLFVSNVGTISMVEGPSMLPTFNVSGDFVLVDMLFWKYAPIQVNQLFMYISPENIDKRVMKRVLGLPGDILFIDPIESDRRITVPQGHVWMAGDNYTHSNDSR